MTADLEPCGAVLTGTVADQAALDDLLAGLEALGVEVLAVREVRPRTGAASRR